MISLYLVYLVLIVVGGYFGYLGFFYHTTKDECVPCISAMMTCGLIGLIIFILKLTGVIINVLCGR